MSEVLELQMQDAVGEDTLEFTGVSKDDLLEVVGVLQELEQQVSPAPWVAGEELNPSDLQLARTLRNILPELLGAIESLVNEHEQMQEGLEVLADPVKWLDSGMGAVIQAGEGNRFLVTPTVTELADFAAEVLTEAGLS